MKTFRLSLAASLLGLLAACGGQGNTGKVSLMLTDATGDFKAAVVTITEIDLVGESGNTVVLRSAPASTPITTNLTALANDVYALVDGQVIPAGTYTQLRFVITDGCIAVNENDAMAYYESSPGYAAAHCASAGAQVGTLRMPSYGQSGLKVDLPGGLVVASDVDAKLLVDFDVAQSFGHEAGNSGAWVMHPVLTATEFQLSGNLAVTLTLPAGKALPADLAGASFEAVLTKAGTTSSEPLVLAAASAAGPWTGTYKYLIPGDFTVSIRAFTGAPPTEAILGTVTTTPPGPATVTVGSGQDASIAFQLAGGVGGAAQ